MKKILIILTALIILRSLYSDTINFNLNDFTFSEDSLTITYKEKTYKKFTFSVTMPIILEEKRFDGQYAESIVIDSYDSVLVDPDLGIAYFINPVPALGDKFPKIPVSIGARGIKRHGGFSVLEMNPFFIKNDSLFFINSINFHFADFKKSNESDSKLQIYEKMDLVIITSEQFADNFEVYKNFKIKEGYKVSIKKIEDIYTEYQGESNVIKIRNYIKDKYIQNDLEFVIIGGAYNIVPVGEMLPYVSSETSYIYSDAFYSNLDGDPDENRNGVYYETSDHPDYYADVYVGRFPGNTENEIDAIINKTIKYYSSDRNFRSNFNTSALFLGFGLTDTNPNSGDGRRLCENIRKELSDEFISDSLYEGSSPDFNFQSIINRFNSGYNFMYSQSHGAIHLIRQINNDFKIWSDQINNTSAISGLYFIGACDPGSIGYDSFSRKAMINPNGGCVNYIGMSGEEYPVTSNIMNLYFFKRIFDDRSYGQSLADAMIMFGNINYNGVNQYLSLGYSFQGDPSNKPFLNEPKTVNISTIGQIKRGNGSVSGSFSTAPADTVFISLIANNEIISKTKTISANFSLNYDNLTSDSVFVNYYSQEIFLKKYGYKTVSADQIEFQVSDISISDGNQSKIVEHGENFGLTFKLSLKSNAAGIDSLVAKVIGTDHSEVTIINGTKRFRLPNVGSYFNIGAFYLKFLSDDSLASDSVAVIDIEIQKKDGTKLYSEKVYIPVTVPYLKLQSVIRTGNILKPKFLNPSKGFISNASIELLESTKSLNRIDPQTFYSKAIISLKKIEGYKIVSDSVSFGIDSTKSYKFAIKIDNDKVYYTENFLFGDNTFQPVKVYADYSIGKINLEWSHSYLGTIKYNVYSSALPDFSVIKQQNFEKIILDKFSFNYDDTSPVYVKVGLIDSTGYEFCLSESVKIEPLPLYKNMTYKVTPFQLYNPVFIDDKLISNSRNSSIGGINKIGTLLNDTGMIHQADLNGFSGSFQQGFAIGDIDADGENDMVNYSYNIGDSTLVKVVNLNTGAIIAQRKIYGKIMENAPVLVNADNDPQLEIFISVFNGDIGGTPAKGAYVYQLDYESGNLNMATGYPKYSGPDSFYVHSPTVLDTNNDDSRELIFDNGTKIVIYNFETSTKIVDYILPKRVQTSLSFCDINDDGNIEIFALTDSYGSYGKLFCYNFNGSTLVEKTAILGGKNVDMKPYNFYDLTPPVNFADIDDNGTIEIIVLTASKLYVYDNNFNDYPNFPITLDSRITHNNSSAPAMADFDGDGYLDILFMDANYRIWCYSGQTGEVLSGFPLQIEGMERFEMTALTVADLDSDGDLEFAVGVEDGVMIVYDYPMMTSVRPVFDYYRGDIYNSGLFQPLIPSSPANVSIINSGTNITISWDAVANVNSYIIYSSDDPYNSFIYEGETSGTSFVIFNVTESKKFYYIKAVR